jgi:serine/threonine protein kinase/outer membrane protein assembly factor BamB
MPTLLTLGEKLEQGHYTVIREIGSGGMGVVYQCRDEYLLRDVAIKMLLPELMSDMANLETFTQEARLAAQLEHPNIVTIYDIGVEDREEHEHHFVAMEYLPGGSLSNQLTFGPLSVEHCLNWMKQLASALSFAHKRGVVHQDIKADNIFITNEGDIKIGDFGLAKLLVGRVHYNTQTRGMGTPAYMSPELCRGETQDYRSDIYSLGVLFFEMATGQLPFQARGMIDMAMKHTSAPIPSVRRLSPQVPEVLEKVVHKMMAKDPDERYQSASDILSVLDELIFELRVNRLGLRSKGLLKSSGQISIDPVRLKEAQSEAEAEAKPEAKEKAPAVPKEVERPKSPLPGARALDQNGGKTPARGLPVVRRTADNTQARISAARLGALLKKEGLKALELVWSFKSNGPIGWSAAPIVDRDEKILFVSSTDSYLYAINTTNGAKLWTYRTGAPIIAGPSLLNDKVITINSKGEIAMLACKDGILLWALKTGLKVVATPTMVKDIMIVTSLDGKIEALDTRRGSVKWVYDCGEPVVSAVQSHGGQLFFGTKQGTVHCLDLEVGKPIWQLQADGPVLGGLAASVDFIYFGTQKGTFYCLEASSGRLVWDYPTLSAITSRGVIVFTTVVFCSQDKWLYCCEKYVGGLVWKGAVRGTTLANLVTVKDSILTVTREGWMQAFHANNGEMKWQRDLARCVESTPLVTSSMLFVPTVEGDVLAYSLNPGEVAVERTA